MIGNCDCCDRKGVPVSNLWAPCDTTACVICQGDTDPDPYGEIDAEVERILNMSDEEIIAETIREGLDPQQVADDMRAIFEKVAAATLPTS